METAAVYEFERQLAGGGGVPDGDVVSLGLGPTCVNAFLSPLSANEGKDEYAASGYLPANERTRLLSEWSPRPAVRKALEQNVGLEISRLQKAREETASSPRDQRFMPSSSDEALAIGSQDEEAARRGRAGSSKLRSSGIAPVPISMLSPPKGEVAKRPRRTSGRR